MRLKCASKDSETSASSSATSGASASCDTRPPVRSGAIRIRRRSYRWHRWPDAVPGCRCASWTSHCARRARASSGTRTRRPSPCCGRAGGRAVASSTGRASSADASPPAGRLLRPPHGCSTFVVRAHSTAAAAYRQGRKRTYGGKGTAWKAEIGRLVFFWFFVFHVSVLERVWGGMLDRIENRSIRDTYERRTNVSVRLRSRVKKDIDRVKCTKTEKRTVCERQKSEESDSVCVWTEARFST